jgi:inorganic pyrophosphatase/exopolyphosphatase
MEFFNLIRKKFLDLNLINPVVSTKKPEIHFILNNSSCDMDSFISSILLSIAKNFSEEKEIISLNDKEKQIFIPIMNCKRGDLKFRLDIAYMMNKFKIDEEILFYINDKEIQEIFENHKALKIEFHIILVDHNKLDQNLNYLSEKVEEIYDHHFDSNNGIDYKNLISKNLKFPLGSCTTLILLDFFISNKNISDNLKKVCDIDTLFYLTAILQDTNNFSQNFYKSIWVDLDYFVFKTIIEKENIPLKNIDEYYKELIDSKYDEKANLNLGVENLMNKDKKKFKWGDFTASWSSLQISLKSIIERFGWDELIQFFEKARLKQNFKNERLNFIITLSTINKEIKKIKVLVIYDYDKIIVNNLEKFKDYLIKIKGSKIKEIKIKKKNEKVIKVYLDESESRKLFEPILNNFFN